jgi:hypothetical protein
VSLTGWNAITVPIGPVGVVARISRYPFQECITTRALFFAGNQDTMSCSGCVNNLVVQDLDIQKELYS